MCTEVVFAGNVISTVGDLRRELEVDIVPLVPSRDPTEDHHCLCPVDIPNTLETSQRKLRWIFDLTWDRYYVEYKEKNADDATREGPAKSRVTDRLCLLSSLAKSIREINGANGWSLVERSDWRDAHMIPAKIALIHSELSEALEEFREPTEDIEGDNVAIGRFLGELADALIRILDLAGGLTDVFDVYVSDKLEVNKRRGHKHGGEKV